MHECGGEKRDDHQQTELHVELHRAEQREVEFFGLGLAHRDANPVARAATATPSSTGITAAESDGARIA